MINPSIFAVVKRSQLIIVLLVFSAILDFRCSQKTADQSSEKGKDTTDHPAKTTPGEASFDSPQESIYQSGKAIPVQLTLNLKKKETIDTLRYFIDDTPYFMTDTNTLHHINTDTLKMGKHSLEARLIFKNGNKLHARTSFTLHPQQPPQNYSYKILNSFPHDKQAYTQGLFYKNGYFYESTGKYGHSSLRKVNKKTGQIVQSYQLPDRYFAEGICSYNDKIIQLTYKKQTAFIYKQENFNQIHQLHYPNREGWGITFNGTHFIMSDGSHKLYYYDTSAFAHIRTVPVYDPNGKESRLNELEYIEGFVFANVYQEDYIIKIDPRSGKITARVKLNDLLSPDDRHPSTGVLNGIAYNPSKGTLFVTGKNWPKLFEIKINP